MNIYGNFYYIRHINDYSNTTYTQVKKEKKRKFAAKVHPSHKVYVILLCVILVPQCVMSHKF